MTIYDNDPSAVALRFKEAGCEHIHIVDLEGAKSGETPNMQTVCAIKNKSGLFCEIGGGIRTMEVVDRYIGAGLDRVILGTAAAENPSFVETAVKKHGDAIAVGIDIRDGFVSLKGWTESSSLEAFDFCKKMQDIGVKTVICTDISKDGAMRGTNRELYREMSKRFDINITASGGVSSLDDLKFLADMKLYGAIIGKAYYTGAIDLKKAVEVAK